MNVPTVSVEECKKKLDNAGEDVILLDVRTSGEYAMTKIADSILIPLNELQSRMKELDKNKIILIYCATGNRSQIACNILQNAGYKKSFDVAGGLSKWQNFGFEIQKGECGNPFAQFFGL
jgi:rhodanese-related sulfurtransferase